MAAVPIPSPPRMNRNGYLKIRNASFETEIVTRELMERLIAKVERLEALLEPKEEDAEVES